MSPSSKISSLGATADGISKQRGTDPRQLTHQLKGDLDWIVLKSLEKDRKRRYETANAFAMDVKRHLVDEPVLAGPPSSAYRLKKFVRRNRASVVAGSLVALALILGVIGTSIGLAWALRQQKRADESARKAGLSADAEKDARKDAEREAKNARDAVQKMLTAVGDEKLRNIPMMDSLRLQLLEDALEFNKRFLENIDSGEVKLEAGMAHLRVAKIYSLLEKNEEALAALQSGRKIFDSLKDNDDKAIEAKKWLAETDQTIGSLLTKSDQDALAEKSIQKSIGQYQALIDDEQFGAESRSGVAIGLQMLGAIRRRAGKNEDAEKYYLDSLEQYQPLLEDPDCLPDYILGSTTTRANLATLYMGTRRPELAKKQYDANLEIHLKLLERDPQDRTYRESLASSYSKLAIFLLNTRKLLDSREMFQKSLDIRQKLAAEFPQVPDYQKDLGRAEGGIAIAYALARDTEEADKRFQKAAVILEKLHQSFPKVTDYQHECGHAIRRIGVHRVNTNKPREAIVPFSRAYKMLKSLADENPDIPVYAIDVAELSFLTATVKQRIDYRDPSVDEWINKAIDAGEFLSKHHPDETDYRHKLAKYYRLLGVARRDRKGLRYLRATNFEIDRVARKIGERSTGHRRISSPPGDHLS